MRKSTIAPMALMATFFAVALAPSALLAQTKIGIMDFDRGVIESERGIGVRAEIEAYQAELASQIEATQDQLAGAQQRYQTGQRVLNETALNELNLQIQRLTTQLNRQLEDADLEMQLKQQELFNPVLNELAAIVETFVQEQGYTLILPPDAVIYASPESDITSQIIERYNASTASAAPAAPAAPAPETGEEPATGDDTPQ